MVGSRAERIKAGGAALAVSDRIPANRHREILGRLVRDLHLSANLIPDAVLAALCLEHGLSMVSADSDFARFTELEWINPVANANLG